jgi:Brp/Blh family beta-carotene 15,15'-monooxygenase
MIRLQSFGTLMPVIPAKLFVLPLVTFCILYIDRYVLPMNSGVATAISSLLILIVGIPHGTLDVEIAITRFRQNKFGTRALIIPVYLLGAALMWGIWQFSPSFALIVFLFLSIVHFSADWQNPGEKFFAIAAGWALIAVPALSHLRDVSIIFEMLTLDGNGGTIAALLACTSIPAFFGSLIFAIQAYDRGDYGNAVNMICCLIAAILLPPLVGFTVFFCGLHSPHHFGEAIRQSGAASRIEKTLRASAVMALSIGVGALLFISQRPVSIDAGVIRMAFVLLSILTVPHFIMDLLIERMEQSSLTPDKKPHSGLIVS